MMATILRLSLTDFDSNENLHLYNELLTTEIKWLFKGKYPADVLFIPYAYDGAYYNTYIKKVRDLFKVFGITVRLMTEGDPAELIRTANGIVIGGGDLAKLLTGIVNYLDLLKARIQSGVPYLGWNEGSVAASPYYLVPPIIPASSRCIGAINKQIYCHYVDTTENRIEIGNFLSNHEGEQPPVTEVVCLKIKPGGSGIRLEDVGSGLVDSPIPGETLPTVFTQDTL
jgi:hypothetical protein